jgi:hypothetical protein
LFLDSGRTVTAAPWTFEFRIIPGGSLMRNTVDAKIENVQSFFRSIFESSAFKTQAIAGYRHEHGSFSKGNAGDSGHWERLNPENDTQISADFLNSFPRYSFWFEGISKLRNQTIFSACFVENNPIHKIEMNGMISCLLDWNPNDNCHYSHAKTFHIKLF